MWHFNSIVVLVFIWLGDGSRLNKSCLHDLGVPNHHCYRVSSQLLVKFISFWYQSFGSKISLTIFYFYSISCSLLKKKKKEMKISQYMKWKISQSYYFQKENFFISILFLTLFKFLTLLMSFGCFSF